MYAVITHCNEVKLVWKSSPMAGNAMPTTVASIAASAEPSTVAIRTHRPARVASARAGGAAVTAADDVTRRRLNSPEHGHSDHTVTVRRNRGPLPDDLWPRGGRRAGTARARRAPPKTPATPAPRRRRTRRRRTAESGR